MQMIASTGVRWALPINMDTSVNRFAHLIGMAVYVATPYTNYATGHDAAAHDAARISAKLMRLGLSVMSPIVHSHAVAQAGDLDKVDQGFWQRMDQPWVDVAEACIVVTLPGWDTSRGVAHEVASFLAAGKPVVYLEPAEIGEGE